MYIMLVSVTGRARVIGIGKSLGERVGVSAAKAPKLDPIEALRYE